MKRVINCALKRYNANARGADVGDCVKRAISLALGKPYETISIELNRIKRDLQYTKYNIRPVWGRLLHTHGLVETKVEDSILLGEFCDLNPVGTFICLTGKPASDKSTHMVCVIDGDIYDTWDSSKQQVFSYYSVSSEKANLSTSDVSEAWNMISDKISSYVESLSNKREYIRLNIGDVTKVNDYTIQVKLVFYLDVDALPSDIRHFYNDRFYHNFLFKVSPRGFDDEEVIRLYKSLKQRIYDFYYNICKDVDDEIAAASLKTHPDFRGHAVDLMKLPEWSRSLVTHFEDDGNTEYTDKYKVYMENLPGDPRSGELSDVAFYADTLTELKKCMEAYRKDYSRVNYDY